MNKSQSTQGTQTHKALLKYVDSWNDGENKTERTGEQIKAMWSGMG